LTSFSADEAFLPLVEKHYILLGFEFIRKTAENIFFVPLPKRTVGFCLPFFQLSVPIGAYGNK